MSLSEPALRSSTRASRPTRAAITASVDCPCVSSVTSCKPVASCGSQVRIEKGGPPAAVGLEMIAIGPCIPCIHEDEILARGKWAELMDDPRQPALIRAGRGADADRR